LVRFYPIVKADWARQEKDPLGSAYYRQYIRTPGEVLAEGVTRLHGQQEGSVETKPHMGLWGTAVKLSYGATSVAGLLPYGVVIRIRRRHDQNGMRYVSTGSRRDLTLGVTFVPLLAE